MDFFDEPKPARWANRKPAGKFESQPGLTPQHPSKNTPYFADSMFADFDNDGALDVVVMNRSESLNPRAMLFMGKSDGTFEIQPSTFSGLDSSGGALDAHFGLGKATSVEVTVKLLNGRSQTFANLAVDRSHQLSLTAR